MESERTVDIKRVPTLRELTVWQGLYGLGLSQEELAKKLGISQPAISQIISKMRKKLPELFDDEDELKGKLSNMIRYDESMDNMVKKRF